MKKAAVPVTDPAIIERIEADFQHAVYRAARLCIRRLHGKASPPAK